MKIDNNIVNLKALVKLDRLINVLHLGNEGRLYFEDNGLVADNYLISLGNAKFYLNGIIFRNGILDDFNLETKDLQAGELMKTLLFLQKFTDPTKKFIENFKNYKGNIHAILYCKKGEFSGYAKLTNITANTVLFNVPLRVPEAEFFMKDNEVNSFASGYAGSEVITHKLHMVNIMSKDRIAFGEVRTKVSKKLVDTYMPKNISLRNYIDVGIDYRIQHRKVVNVY